MDVNLKTYGIFDINLKPKEIFLSERGAMSFCDGGIKYMPIEMNLFKSIKRFLGGESFFSIVKYENLSNIDQNLKLRYNDGFSFFYRNSLSSEILIIDLKKINGSLIVKSGAFFASTKDVIVDVYLDSNWGRSLFGYGKLFKQKITGTGTVFLKKDNWLYLEEIIIENGKSLVIDPKEVYAYSLDSLSKTNSKFSFFNFLSGEGFSSYNFHGPATIYTYKNKPSDFNTSSFLSSPIILIIILIIVMRVII
ncbi:AIM24 family protein [Flavobacterium lacisediminis]|uniref:AIM24 family protein n=1 Tax=Flavobacterium lacisediminis TaxID=2989705 RepID=A0ABT3EKS5_9FLAO|nr:AIM24 family protein [Flavobacterium lacisediminis]MCW1149183.1 AIM24 family protein [Flavobacterium lacisediminis]